MTMPNNQTNRFQVVYCQLCGDGKAVNQDALYNGMMVKYANNAHAKAVDLAEVTWPLRLGVADGVSHSPSPHLASRFWMRALAADRRTDFRFLRELHEPFCEAMSECDHGTATTFAGALIDESGCSQVANIGNSRIYHIHADGQWQQISVDHTILNQMLDNGQAQADVEYANIYQGLLHCLCADPMEYDYEIAQTQCQLHPGETLLICSDGLTDALNHNSLAQIWSQDDDLVVQLDHLRQAVRQQPGHDDCSIVACRYQED